VASSIAELTRRIRAMDVSSRAAISGLKGRLDSIEVTAWPDGSIVTDTALRVDRLTGVVHAAR